MFAEADPLLQMAQTACPESPEALRTLATLLLSLAGLRFECSRLKEALDYCLHCLEIRERTLSPLDPLLGNTLLSAGIVYMENGLLVESLRCHLKAVKLHEAGQRDGKHDGSPTAFAYMDLAICYWKMDQLDDANEFVEKAADLFRVTSGELSQKYGQ